MSRNGAPGLVPRADAYPERTAYRDTGCAYHPACLSCPLPECVLELPPRGRPPKYDPQLVRELQATGMGRIAIAAELGISTRQVSRLWARKVRQ